MQKILDKKQSIFVLLLMCLFSLLILICSIKVMNNAKDLNLQAEMTGINTSIMEYYINHHSYPKENTCNLKIDCMNFRKQINAFIDQNIYYISNEKDYMLYSPSFVNKKIYFITGPSFSIDQVLEIPEL